jgi:1-deoxy-D-xylulose-5-phosphate reductoisomerase
VLNAANEIAVASFLDGEIRFPDVTALVQEALNDAGYGAPRSIGDVLEIDRVTREKTRGMMKASCS